MLIGYEGTRSPRKPLDLSDGTLSDGFTYLLREEKLDGGVAFFA